MRRSWPLNSKFLKSFEWISQEIVGTIKATLFSLFFEFLGIPI